MSRPRPSSSECLELIGIMVEDVIRALKQTRGTVEHCSASMMIIVRQHQRIRRAHFKVLRQRAAARAASLASSIVVLIVLSTGCGGGDFTSEASSWSGGSAGASSSSSSSQPSSSAGSTGGSGGETWSSASTATSQASTTAGPASTVGSGGGSSTQSSTGSGGNGGTTYGPVHVLAGKSSSLFVTQFGCSPTGFPAGDAAWFCVHFYGPECAAAPGWAAAQQTGGTMMHVGSSCFAPDPTGVDVPGTTCIGGPCRIGEYAPSYGGLEGLVCECP